METMAITQYVDVAQLVLYLFWIFFFGLVYYLLQENHRDGYPLDSGRTPPVKMDGWPPIPTPKTYLMANGDEVVMPYPLQPPEFLQAEPRHRYIGAPIEPTGNPLLAGVGPGSWANRADVPDHTPEGEAKIVPLRTQPEYGVATQDDDPRGLPVVGDDDEVAGTVNELWMDRSEMMFRYIEVKLNDSGRTVMLPVPFARITKDKVKVHAILGHQFADVPGLRNADQITMLEEEKISAYYGAGTLYATPERQEPLV
ncbi:MAG: Reaction center protein chain [Pseudomonadota bacterium]|jgi:photosynthetic reaction center H subunit